MEGTQPQGDENMSPTKTRSLTPAETAKLVRRALKDAYPAVKFSVRTRTYAGGASVSVEWTDGPTNQQVEATAKLYAGATFDGMTDMKSYHDTLMSTEDGAELVRFGADFVSCQRRLSEKFRAELEREIADFTSEPYNPTAAYHAAALGDTWDGPRELCHSTHETNWGLDLLLRLAENRTRTSPRERADEYPTHSSREWITAQATRLPTPHAESQTRSSPQSSKAQRHSTTTGRRAGHDDQPRKDAIAPSNLPGADMSPTPIEESHAELAELGMRITRHDEEAAAIDRDLATAIERAREARLSMSEIAHSVGVTRATLYHSLHRAKTHTTKHRPGKRHSTPPAS
jgi:hypothetical protein